MDMAPLPILIVEDEKNARLALEKALVGPERTILGAASAEEALELFLPGETALVVTDVKLPGYDGIWLLQQLRQRDPAVYVIVMTAFGSVDLGVRAMKLGAYDFIEKPLDLQRIRLAVQAALADAQRRRVRGALEIASSDRFCDIIGASAAMRAVFELITRVADSNARVLITGENGTGKELVARAIHQLSPRRSGPLIEINLAAMAPTLIESELFGHEAGAFTDARARKLGVFDRANGGTLFLDEIGEIPAEIQVKLLRVIQQRSFERVGGVERVNVDVRLIFATNKDLELAVERGQFREDLYYRINVIRIEVPPLRERRGDIPLLVNHFIRRFAAENGRDVVGVSEEALALLERFHWPGNVRQLENCIENAVVLGRDDILGVELFPLEVRTTSLPVGEDHISVPIGTTLQAVEREMILRTLDHVDGNKTAAAKVLGISPRTLYRKLDEYARP
jgi:DNA-binding NtrC family response regulator